ncbi:MAG: UMP kinase [Oscillospiraceae bacterium]|nr:UMP kinase [Oscillospiraceae bacterium]
MGNKYKRVLIKISGEALSAGEQPEGGKAIINYKTLRTICEKIKTVHDSGTDVSVVVGGGNIWRGEKGAGFERVRSDHMGMLATAINALAIQDTLEQMGLDTRVMTAIEMNQFAEPYIRNKAISHLSKNRVVIFGCGIGSPYFSTDTTAVLRAKEIGADIVLFAKNGTDGIYDSDPNAVNSKAKFLPHPDYNYILSNKLAVIDGTAAAFAQKNNIKCCVFNLNDPENIVRIARGEDIGSIVEE